MPNAAEITRVLGNRFLPENCDDVHTHFKRNWYELAGQPASQFRQPVEMVTQALQLSLSETRPKARITAI